MARNILGAPQLMLGVFQCLRLMLAAVFSGLEFGHAVLILWTSGNLIMSLEWLWQYWSPPYVDVCACVREGGCVCVSMILI